MISIHWSGSPTHPNLVQTDQVEGGYWISPRGGSATVHMNHDRERVTMDNPGSYTLEGDLLDGDFDDREEYVSNGSGATRSRWVDLKDDGSLEVKAIGVDDA